MENFNQAMESAVEGAEASQGSPQSGKTATPTAEQVFDLDSASKFKFGGKEMTVDELKKQMMLHSDYTKKTQAIAETQKYWKNLDKDLAAIRANPTLVDQFKQIYPKEFHSYINFLNLKPTAQDSGESQDSMLKQELAQIKEYLHGNEVKAKEAELDSIFAKNLSKYSQADEDAVMARAQVLLDAGNEPTKEFWENLFKQSHEKVTKRFEEYKKQALQGQREANKAGRGPGKGGGTPGEAPKRLTMKEATEAAVRDYSRK